METDTLYLSRLGLNPRERAVQADLADCQSLHRTIMAAFPPVAGGAARQSHGVLHRVDVHPQTGAIVLLVQSRLPPDWSHLPPRYLTELPGSPNPTWKPVHALYAGLKSQDQLGFRLRANPTRKIETKSGPAGERHNGRRVELRDEAAQLAWLRRKGEQHGFALGQVRGEPDVWNVRANPTGKVTGGLRPSPPTRGGRQLTFAAVTFDGELRVTDADRFRAALVDGIGSAKAYGFGLLSIWRGEE
jgi:CRISPR system Cascade subunit CasE